MTKQDKKEEYFVSRNIVEIRLKKKFFEFIDVKGKFLDTIFENREFEKVKFSDNMSRIDIANSDLSRIYFFGISSYGFQVDGQNSLLEFGNEIDKFFDFLSEHSEMKYGDIFRLGVRCQILYNKNDRDFNAILQTYREKVFSSYERILSKSNSTIKDLMIITESEDEAGQFKIQTAPITKKQALEQYLISSRDFYKDILDDNAMYFDIDYSQKQDFTGSLKVNALKKLKNIEGRFNDFKDYFFD